jgi:hypothetical protein
LQSWQRSTPEDAVAVVASTATAKATGKVTGTSTISGKTCNVATIPR